MTKEPTARIPVGPRTAAPAWSPQKIHVRPASAAITVGAAPVKLMGNRTVRFGMGTGDNPNTPLPLQSRMDASHIRELLIFARLFNKLSLRRWHEGYRCVNGRCRTISIINKVTTSSGRRALSKEFVDQRTWRDPRVWCRSEERRVGKECRSRGSAHC